MCILRPAKILGMHAMLLSDVLFQPLKAFLGRLTLVTDLAELFSGFGVSCAYHELRTFRSRLLISTILPIVVSLCGAAFFVCRSLMSHPTRARVLRRTHSTFVLLVLYVTLPSTSTMIFKTFVRDSRPLGTNGEQYLIADYSGKSPRAQHGAHCTYRRRWCDSRRCLPLCSQYREHGVQELFTSVRGDLHHSLSRWRKCVVCRAIVEKSNDDPSRKG